MAGKPIDLKGKTFARLTVLEDVGRYGGGVLWKCQCACGVILNVPAQPLKSGRTKSCGCYRRDSMRQKMTIHGETGSIRYGMLKNAKERANEKNIPFSLTIKDIPEVPEACPILGVPFVSRVNRKTFMPFSPSLDRIIPSLGYTAGNIQIISHRANVIKNDATAEEVMRVALHMQGVTIAK